MRVFISIVLMMLAIAIFAISIVRTNKYTKLRKKKEKKHPDKEYMRLDSFTTSLYVIGAILFIVALLLPGKSAAKDKTELGEVSQFLYKDTDPKAAVTYGVFRPSSEPYSNPTRVGVGWEVLNNGVVVTNLNRRERIYFGAPEEYFALPGIPTFRGNNYRSSASYGTARVSEGSLTTIWDYDTGILEGTVWAGCSWTGQPLIVEWDEDVRRNMNIYRYKQNKDHLVEVIYPTTDGYIYFMDLEDGEPTRNPINIGQCFHGTGSLDPRGYPLLYVGMGNVTLDGDKPQMLIINLLTNRVIFRYGDVDRNSLRIDNDNWTAYDAAPLIDADTDTLIWPGENGIIYTFKLNTEYDREGGTISVAPNEPIRTRYFTNRMEIDEYWYGYESSPSIVENYLYVADNGGMFFCVNLSTMELAWAQDIKDDTNGSPVIERINDGCAYVYTAPALRWTANSKNEGTISLYKIDAVTGRIIWETAYDVYITEEYAGGVHSTPLLGAADTNIENLVIYTIANHTPEGGGIMVALDKETGEEVWRRTLESFTLSSPISVTERDGTTYIIVCDNAGKMTLVNGVTGQGITSIDLGSPIEASPAIYEDIIVIGTTGQKIFGIKIK